MNIKELNPTIKKLLEKMDHGGSSPQTIGTAQWVLGHFEKHCREEGVEDIDMSIVASFLEEKYGIDYQNTTTPMQTVMRRPLLALIEFYESGNYLKSHQRGSTTEIPFEFVESFLKYRDFVNAQPLVISSKERKLWVMTTFFTYLVSRQITTVDGIGLDDAYEYLDSRSDFGAETRRTVAGIIREAYNWMYDQNMIAFTGRDAFPLLRKVRQTLLLSYFTHEEVMRLLDCIDVTTKIGKRDFFVISIVAFLGLRAGDVINLKFSDIDWGNNTINIIQQKTGAPLSLPLIDEVKYPLLDYVKNARPKSDDEDYVLITRCGPHTRYVCGGSLGRIVTKCMDKAGVNYENKHHGPHSLRHSLASGMINENVPISAIANILGHQSSKTTEAYLTVDRASLRELSLEVRDVL